MPDRAKAQNLVRRSRQYAERLRVLIVEMRRDGHADWAELAESLLGVLFRAEELLEESRDVMLESERSLPDCTRGEPRIFSCKRCGLDVVLHGVVKGGHAIDYETTFKAPCRAEMGHDGPGWTPLGCSYFRHSLGLAIDQEQVV